jgi:hypothetical protein
MKRDMDLVRDLLLKIEEAKEPPALSDLVSKEDDEKYETATYHLKMLIDEVGLVRGINCGSMDGEDWIELNITWTGHEFLDTVRDPEVWRKTKEGAKKIGGFTLDILMQLATGYLKMKAKELGLGV